MLIVLRKAVQTESQKIDDLRQNHLEFLQTKMSSATGMARVNKTFGSGLAMSFCTEKLEA